ncbi:hypothetical protein ABT331_19090 [Streptomyces sp. NPDC000659]|uniref:hypothetical protein n=1 Tax=unclassified Streptomyces TaxID=2593676 RepID=UPI00331B3A97
MGEEAGSRACTATLVDQWWIATAASCFASEPRRPGGPAAGRPAVWATVTLSAARVDDLGAWRSRTTEAGVPPRAPGLRCQWMTLKLRQGRLTGAVTFESVVAT